MMSAYIVFHNHINAIVKWASEHNVARVPGNEQATAELLRAENTRSVNYRYEEANPVGSIVFDFDAPDLTPIELIKACRLLTHQCGETVDWETTPACQLLKSCRREALDQLPGYERAAWSTA